MAEVTVQWWKANEPKMVKHSDWEKDVVPALQSWESTKKTLDTADGGTNVLFYAQKLHGWGVSLQKLVKAKHDGLNSVVHGATRKKLQELLAEIGKKTNEAEAMEREFAAAKEKELRPNAGRPLPKPPVSKNAWGNS